ncbi:MAG TPA: CsbD family protein [Candidatus Binataceae bacterium]|nr:CsbD family protein [Candidatus Binataceae bacterium]
MNKDQTKGKWNQLKGEIKRRWARVTDDDLLEVEGDMDKLAGRIQERTGDRKEEIRRWLDEQH